MPLSSKKVLELNLIEDLCEREIKSPEGVGLDLRVGEVFKIEGDGFLGIEDRHTPKKILIAKYDPDEIKEVTINPGDYLLVKTIESINTPSEKITIEDGSEPRYLMPYVYPRSTLQRCGISFHATKTDPGYHGQLVFGIANPGNNKFTFELGSRMFNIVFYPVIGEIEREYDGQNQNGRVTSDGKTEKQN